MYEVVLLLIVQWILCWVQHPVLALSFKEDDGVAAESSEQCQEELEALTTIYRKERMNYS